MSSINPLGRQSASYSARTEPMDTRPRATSASASPILGGSPTSNPFLMQQVPELIQQNGVQNNAQSGPGIGMTFSLPQGGGLPPIVFALTMYGGQQVSLSPSTMPMAIPAAPSSAPTSLAVSSRRSSVKELCDLPPDELKETMPGVPKIELHNHLEGALLARKLLEIAGKAGLWVRKSFRPKSKRTVFVTENELSSGPKDRSEKELSSRSKDRAEKELPSRPKDKEKELLNREDYIKVSTALASQDSNLANLVQQLLKSMTMMAGSNNPMNDTRCFHEAFKLRGEIRDRVPLGYLLESIIDDYQSQNVPFEPIMYDQSTVQPPEVLSQFFTQPDSSSTIDLEDAKMVDDYIQSRIPAYEAFLKSPELQHYVGRYKLAVKEELDRSEEHVRSVKGFGYTDVSSPVCVRMIGEIMKNKPHYHYFAKLLATLDVMEEDPRMVSFTPTGPEHESFAINGFLEQVAMMHFLCKRFHERTGRWPNSTFHAGETHQAFADENFLKWFPKIILKYVRPRRISHGTSFLSDHYKMLANPDRLTNPDKLSPDSGVLLEICAKSNEVMFGVNPKDHHLSTAQRHGCDVHISSDDPGVTCSSLSNEYVTMIKKKKLTNATFLAMQRAAIHHCDLPGESPYKKVGGKWALKPEFEGVDRKDWTQGPKTKSFLEQSEKAQMAVRYEKLIVEYEEKTGVSFKDAAEDSPVLQQESPASSSVESEGSQSHGSDSDD